MLMSNTQPAGRGRKGEREEGREGWMRERGVREGVRGRDG